MDMAQIWTGLRLTQSTKVWPNPKKKKTEAPKTNKINS